VRQHDLALPRLQTDGRDDLTSGRLSAPEPERRFVQVVGRDTVPNEDTLVTP